MVSSKPKKIIFLMLIAALAGGSMVAYAQSETSFLIKTVELVVFQQFAAMAIYLICFSQDLFRMR